MSHLRLTKTDLDAIANALEKLETAELNVRQFEVSGYTIYVDRSIDQRDGTTYFVTGITNERKQPQIGPHYRPGIRSDRA